MLERRVQASDSLGCLPMKILHLKTQSPGFRKSAPHVMQRRWELGKQACTKPGIDISSESSPSLDTAGRQKHDSFSESEWPLWDVGKRLSIPSLNVTVLMTETQL